VKCEKLHYRLRWGVFWHPINPCLRPWVRCVAERKNVMCDLL